MNPAEDPVSKMKKSPRSEYPMSPSPIKGSSQLSDSPESSSSSHSSLNSPSSAAGSPPAQDITHKKIHRARATAAVVSSYSGSRSTAGLFSARVGSPTGPHAPHAVLEDAIKITLADAPRLSDAQLEAWKQYSVSVLKCLLSQGDISPDELKNALDNKEIFERFTAKDFKILAFAGTQISSVLLECSRIKADPMLVDIITRVNQFIQNTRSPGRVGGF